MLLADAEVEAIKSLAQNWPIISLIAASIVGFYRGIARPMLARHIQYLDASETQMRANAEIAIRQMAMLDSLANESQKQTDKLSVIKELATAAKCHAVCPMQPPQGV